MKRVFAGSANSSAAQTHQSVLLPGRTAARFNVLPHRKPQISANASCACKKPAEKILETRLVSQAGQA
ncbi:MAG: hypothetical protein IH623_18565 [Verrucomicrobia bacterium]|nr:hypothetical protein [Verrucomicrobiota bacterium]